MTIGRTNKEDGQPITETGQERRTKEIKKYKEED
jgi:hypothetical protein